ncbi:MAG TPA: VWA domain-containing protein [Myxococcales bacterium]|jgi:hypothetical protein
MKRRLGTAFVFALASVAGCTDTYVYDPSAGRHGMEDRAIRASGRFCTEATDDLSRPIKLLFAMDTSESMSATDPDGTRAKALLDLLDSLPDTPEIEIGVMLFAGDVAWITNGGTSGFQQLQSMSQSDRDKMAATILSYAYAGQLGGANRDTTDFVKPLSEIFATISADISKGHQAASSSGNPELARYSVIFLSDGHPRDAEAKNDEIMARCSAIRALKSDAGDVVLNTVHVFNPVQPIPTFCAADAGQCQAEIIEQDAARLKRMAEKGGGEFRDFRDGEPINFLSFHLGGIKRAFLVKDIQVYNLDARPNSLLEEADSDSDGLPDAEELLLNTDPTKRDSDGDGFSDGVERYFADRGGPFDPVWRADGTSLNKGCPNEVKGKDDDHDGLLDCDELLVGTSNTKFDTDGDGIPDVMEWLGHTQPGATDDESDPDRDGLTNAVEVRGHTDPLLAEDSHLTDRAYRYQMHQLPITEATGRICYDFSVDNVLLVPTLDTGEGKGVNHLMMTVVQVGGDDLGGPPLYRVARFTATYPYAGIKDPPDGVIPLSPADFIAP